MSAHFSSLVDFYASDALRLTSSEVDVGLLWRDGLDGPTYRAAWVSDTGEFYVVRHADPEAGGGEVEVLARFGDRSQLDAAMRGFAHVCGHPESAAWLRARAALARTAEPVA
jgi:hypothetical protein